MTQMIIEELPLIKVILFNRQGSLIKKHSFLFKSNNIEVTKQYKYLGFNFSCSGSTISHPQRTKIRITILHFLILKKNKAKFLLQLKTPKIVLSSENKYGGDGAGQQVTLVNKVTILKLSYMIL